MISPNKQHKASPKMLSFVFSLAVQFGVDAEALSSMHFSKDFADLSEVEADALLKQSRATMRTTVRMRPIAAPMDLP